MGQTSERHIEEHNRRMATDECYAEWITDMEISAAQDADPEYQLWMSHWMEMQFEINQAINWFPYIRTDYTGYEEKDVLGWMFRGMFRQLQDDDIPF